MNIYLKESMIKTIKHLLVMCVCLLCMTACGSDAVDTHLSEAEAAVAAGNYDVAQDLCDSMSDDATLASMRASQLGRLSIVYMQLDERESDGRNARMAQRCYSAAYATDADSARIFYAGLSAQEFALAETLRQLDEHGDESVVDNDDIDPDYGGNDSAGDVDFTQDIQQ